MESYDENLAVNPFFVSLKEQGKDLYDTIATNRWTICVPRLGTVEDSLFTEKDFLNHVLIQDNEHVYNTLSNKVVTIQGSCISTGAGFEESRAVLILFEETYFNEKDESYQVLCINQPLEGGPRPVVTLSDLAPNQIVHSIQDCANLLWQGAENSKTQRSLDDLTALFNRSCTNLEAESLRHLVDAANALFTRGMQTVLRDARLRKNVKTKPNFMEHVKLAVETYTMHGVYKKLFKHITTCTASHDSRLNKITRNLAELQLRDLGVRQEFCYNVPWARRELANLKRYSTPLGKLSCIRRVVQRLQQPPRGVKPDDPAIPLTTDDLLPILVFLVVKSEMPNWWAHFYYMTGFRFAKASNDDEYGFYLATLEAALEHVGSGQLNALELGAENPQRVQLSMSPEAGSIWQRQESSDTQTNILFQYIREGDQESVRLILERADRRGPTMADIQERLCHPLCSCTRCSEILAELETDNSATVFSRDDRGYTVLHIAALQGSPEMADYLLKKGAIVNATDYHGHSPLHVSCQKGQQAVTLLLLHYKSDMNLQDNDGNSPLHLACANGHEECVKALVYYDHHNIQLNVNVLNDFGDTPLHLAAKWGYESIVEILWENGASVKTKNRKKQTPLDCAHNIKVARILVKASEDRDRQIRRRSSDNVLKMTRSASLHGIPVTGVNDSFVSSTVSSVGGSVATTNGLTRSMTLPTNRSTLSSQRSTPPPSTEYTRRVDKLLKATADGDLQMVRFHLGWTDDALPEVEDMDVTQQALCHPLCQCEKCSPIQQLTTSATGIYVNSSNQDGLTPLHVAAVHGHPALVELFCKRGANVNMKTSVYELSPLHCACQNNRRNTEEVVGLLLDYGAKVNHADSRGNTPLHLCCLTGNRAAAYRILKAKAQVNQVNAKGNTPLHEAARWNSVSLTKLLLQEGATVNIRNRKQQTPLHLAQNDKVLRLLLEASQAQGPGSISSTGEPEYRAPKGMQRSVSVDSANLRFRASSSGSTTQQEPETGGTTKKVAIRDLFAALAEKDIETLENLSRAIQGFDRRRNLRHTITRDRSSPRLDHQLACQLSIRHFDTGTLRRTATIERQTPVLVLPEDKELTPINTHKDVKKQPSSSNASCPSLDDGRERVTGAVGNQSEAQKMSAILQSKLEKAAASLSGAELLSPPPVGAVGGRDEDDRSWGSSVSSEDSDIFVREREFIKFVPVPYTTTTATAPTPAEYLEADLQAVAGAAVMTVTCEGSDSIIGYKPPSIQPTEGAVTTESLQTSPQLGILCGEEANDCGSDAEADVFFRDNTSVNFQTPGGLPIQTPVPHPTSNTDRLGRSERVVGSSKADRVTPAVGTIRPGQGECNG